MKKDWKFQRNAGRDDDQKKLLGALAIPLLVIVLILVIVVADRCGKEEPEPESSEVITTVADTMVTTEAQEPEGEAEPEVPEETEPTDAFAAENFERDSIPEILDLMKRYFDARATADAVAMNQLYGIGEEDISVTQLEEQKTRMRSNSKYVTGFEGIATYVKPGKTTDTWLVYTIAEIKFRSVEATAPMIMWCYVTKDAEGNVLLSDGNTLAADVLAYVDAAGRSEEVRRLAADVNTRLKTALNEDSDLQQVYGILNSDSPLWVDDKADTEPEVVILGDETAEADSAEADSTEADLTEADSTEANTTEAGAESTEAGSTEASAAAPSGE